MSNIATYVWPGRTRFGYGAVTKAGSAARDLGARHALLITDPGVSGAGLLAPVTTSLEKAGIACTVYDACQANPSDEAVAAATEAFRQSEADLLVGVGGGSALDTAKAARLMAGAPPEAVIGHYSNLLRRERHPLPPASVLPPYLAIPTTAGTGSEVTPWAMISDEAQQVKYNVGDWRLVPNAALVDPELTLSLPAWLTAATGLDALSHLVEAYVSTNENPILDPMILYGIELVGRSLRPAVALGSNRQAREEMMLASLIGGIAFSSKWLGACHALAHPLTALAGLHHGLACGLMLPHQMRYSLPGAIERYAAVGRALGAAMPAGATVRQQAAAAPEAVAELLAESGLPTSLSEAGVDASLLPALARAAYADTNWVTNPRQVSREAFATLYKRAL